MGVRAGARPSRRGLLMGCWAVVELKHTGNALAHSDRRISGLGTHTMRQHRGSVPRLSADAVGRGRPGLAGARLEAVCGCVCCT